MFLAEMGKIDEAAADLKKLLSGKDDRDIYVSLANTYEKGKKWDDMGKALDAAEKLSDSTEDKSGIWFMRGAMLERMKKLDKAEVEFRKVLKADPDNAGAMNYIGYMLADANLRLEESLDLITKALEIEPGNGAYLDSLGWVQYRLGAPRRRRKESPPRPRQNSARSHLVHDHIRADILLRRESKVKEAVAQWGNICSKSGTPAPPPTSGIRTEIAQVKRKLEATSACVWRAKALYPRQ